MDEGPRYGLRKRRRVEEDPQCSSGLDRLLTASNAASRILVFSGSGLSASSGMSTFSTPGGLYERAQKQFGLADGKTLFTYQFFEKSRLAAQAFLADVYKEALTATPAPGHQALAALDRAGRLQRHYTLNIDGLAEKAGMLTWHPTSQPDGMTVELHGNVHDLVCVECGTTAPLTIDLANHLSARVPLPCSACLDGIALRPKVMLYEDADSEVITPDDVLDRMEEDAQASDLILWVGISFQQSASTAYFRRVRRALQEVGRADAVVQAIVNPSDEALWNLLTASSNQHELNVLEVLASADEVLPQMAAHIVTRNALLQHPSPPLPRPVELAQSSEEPYTTPHDDDGDGDAVQALAHVDIGNVSLALGNKGRVASNDGEHVVVEGGIGASSGDKDDSKPQLRHRCIDNGDPTACGHGGLPSPAQATEAVVTTDDDSSKAEVHPTEQAKEGGAGGIVGGIRDDVDVSGAPPTALQGHIDQTILTT